MKVRNAPRHLRDDRTVPNRPRTDRSDFVHYTAGVQGTVGNEDWGGRGIGCVIHGLRSKRH